MNRVRALAALGIGLVLASVLLAVARSDPRPSRELTRGPSPTGPASTMTEATTSTSDPPSTTASAGAPPTTTTDQVPIPVAAPSCRNSTDPRCGPFRWDPEPSANRPLEVDVSFVPAEPSAGEGVVFTVTAVDPDGPLFRASCVNSRAFDDGEEPTPVCFGPCSDEERHGPWDPPAAARTELSEVHRHTSAEPGVDMVCFAFNVGDACERNPYLSAGRAGTFVTVTS